MADEDKTFWEDARGKLRRAFNLDPLCQEESEKEYKKAKGAQPLSAADIDAIVDFAQSFGERGGLIADPEPDGVGNGATPEYADPIGAEDMSAELMELVNRNPGEQDKDIIDILNKHRRRELGDEKDNENGDDGQDKT